MEAQHTALAYTTAWASPAQLPVLIDYWYKMCCEMGAIDGVPRPEAKRIAEVGELLAKEMASGQLAFRVVLDAEGRMIACAGGLLRTEYATPLSQDQVPFGWIISVYTLPEYRGLGLANRLVDEVCQWLAQRGAKRARLWSSSGGRSTYLRLGFRQMIDMEKPLTK